MPKTKSAKKGFANRHIVTEIVDRGLCVRCGACEPACPVNIIRFDDQAYPYITDEPACIRNCTKCIAICPGEVVNFERLDQRFFGTQPHPDSITGIAKYACVGFATDPKTREAGASGGLVTQLLVYLLEKRLIDGALVLRANTDNGWTPEPAIIRTAEELKRTQKSTYTLVPHLKVLSEIEKTEGHYAIVALPCHVHAIRRYQRFNKKLAQRIKLVIGLYCNVAFEPYAFDDLCEFSGLKKQDVIDFSFRHGTWPGGIVARGRDGTSKKILKLEEMRDEFNLLKLFYTPSRCNTCIDFGAEHADIAVGDPWLKGRDGKLMFTDNRTTVLVRTDVGEQLFRRAIDDGYIAVEPLPLKTFMVNFENAARYKRSIVPKYILLRKMVGLPVPKYHRDLPLGKMKDFLPVIARITILGMSKFRWFRRFALFMAQTRPAIAYFAWNRERKEKRFSAAYAQHERFVEKVITKQ
jgi:coenzyme F420 hydrogenase subunit beta